MARRARGAASVWTLVFVALVCAGVIFSANATSPSQPLLVMGLLALFAALAGLAYEARRDLYAFCGVAALAAIPVAVVGSIAALEADDDAGRIAGAVLAGLFGALCVASFLYMRRARAAKDSLPDLLREQFKPAEIYEQDGVQFAWEKPAGAANLLAGEQLTIRVVAQNCFDAERTLGFVLEAESRVSFNRAKLEFAKETRVTLPPLSTAQLIVPIRAAPKAKGNHSLLVDARVQGREGTRVRKPRGKAISRRASWMFLVLGHLGHILRALRPRIRIVVRPAPALSFEGPAMSAPLAASTSEIVWRPDSTASTGGPGEPLGKQGPGRSPAPLAIAGLLLVLVGTGYVIVNSSQAAPPPASGAAVFSAARDLRIIHTREPRAPGTQGPATLRLSTEGLGLHQRAELELVGIPEPLAGSAEALLEAIGESTVNDAEVKPGEIWGAKSDGFRIVARVVQSKDGGGVLRVCDFDDETHARPARMAVTAMAMKQHLDLLQSNKTAEPALALIRAAIAWYPGEPGPGARLERGLNANQNDNLAYLALASLQQEPERNYLAALQRSEALVLTELGGARPPAAAPEVLSQDAASLVRALQSAGPAPTPPVELDAASLPAGAQALLSPVLALDDGGKLERQVLVGDSTMRSYFYESPAKSALGGAELPALAAGIYSQWQPAPEQALVLLRETIHDVYGDGFEFTDAAELRPAPAIPIAGADAQDLPMLSRIVAALGRELAAGETPPEIRARWKLSDDAAARASAEKKLAALRKRE